MEDIKITLSTKTDLRSPSIEEEARWMQEEGELYYPIPNRPLRSAHGCYVYFIRNSQLVGRSKILEFTRRTDPEESYTYTDERLSFKKWTIKCSKIEIVSERIPSKGFQGFRYITDNEKEEFESAFRK